MRVALAGYQGTDSVLTQALRDFAEKTAAAGFKPAVQPDVTIAGGTARGLFDAVEAGRGPRACYLASGYLSARVPALGALDLPYAAPDRAPLFAALDGAAGAMLRDAVAATTGLRVLGFWDNGLRHLSNARRPIRAPADCAGLVVRTLDNATYRATLAAMGFRPVVTDVLRLREAVAAGEVDAQENPLTNTLGFGLHAHHRFVSLTGHLQGVALLVCNAAWFDRLDGAACDAIRVAADAATLRQRAAAVAEDARALAALERLGVAVLPAAALDMAGFRAACAPVAVRVAAALDPALLRALG